MPGRTHNSSFSMYRIGGMASQGLKKFVETSSADELDESSQGADGVFDAFNGAPITAGVGQTETQFFVDGNHTLVIALSSNPTTAYAHLCKFIAWDARSNVFSCLLTYSPIHAQHIKKPKKKKKKKNHKCYVFFFSSLSPFYLSCYFFLCNCGSLSTFLGFTTGSHSSISGLVCRD